MVLKVGATIGGVAIETIVFPPGAVLADGTVAGIPAKGDAAGWLRPDIDTLCAVWVPACLSDGRGSARTVGPVLKDANGHEYTLSPSTTPNSLVRTYTEIGISDELLITKANLLAAGLVCQPWVVTALAVAPVTDQSAGLVGASVEATPGGLPALLAFCFSLMLSPAFSVFRFRPPPL